MRFWRSDFPESFFSTSILPDKFIDEKSQCYRDDVDYQISIANQYRMPIESHQKRSQFVLKITLDLAPQFERVDKSFGVADWKMEKRRFDKREGIERQAILSKHQHPWKIDLWSAGDSTPIVLMKSCFPGNCLPVIYHLRSELTPLFDMICYRCLVVNIISVTLTFLIDKLVR